MGLFNFKEKRLQKILDSEREIEFNFSSASDPTKILRESKTRLLTSIKKEYPENSFLEFGKELPSLAMSFLDLLLHWEINLRDYGEDTDEEYHSFKLEQLRINLRRFSNMEYDDVLKSDFEELIVQGYTREEYHAPTIAVIGVITMAKLELTENDTIEIFSKGYRTVAKAKTNFFSKEHTGFILIHDLQQFNAQVRVGDTVKIRKIKKIKADKIILVPKISLPDFPDSLSYLKYYGFQEPVFMIGDRITVPVSPVPSSPCMEFTVLTAVPKPSTDEITAFYFTDETEFHIAEIERMSEEDE